MEEDPENGKGSSHSAHANGMNEYICMYVYIYIYICTQSNSVIMSLTLWRWNFLLNFSTPCI